MRKSKHFIRCVGLFVLMLVVLFCYPQTFGTEKETSGHLFQISEEEKNALNDFQNTFMQMECSLSKSGSEWRQLLPLSFSKSFVFSHHISPTNDHLT